MKTVDLRPLHGRALELTSTVIDQVRPGDSGRPTPCPPWDLHALLAHMIGQNHGFTAAVESGEDVAVTAFAPRRYVQRPGAEWQASCDRIRGVFARCDLERPVLLPEISTGQRFPAATAIGFHLLDTVVHGWDVATSLGVPYRPDDDLVAVTLRLAELVPDGANRERPDAAFAPAVPVADDADRWLRARAILGRNAGVNTARPA
jgi:uncharacterized protein (TIGR03086 family)